MIIGLLLYKYTDMKKLLAPRVVKREPELADFITKAHAEGELAHDEEVDLNPVLQARLLLEEQQRQEGGANRKRPAHAAGALRRLKLNLTGKKGDKGDKYDAVAGMHRVDIALQKDLKKAKAAEKKRAHDEAMMHEAQRAAMEAQQMGRRTR